MMMKNERGLFLAVPYEMRWNVIKSGLLPLIQLSLESIFLSRRPIHFSFLDVDVEHYSASKMSVLLQRIRREGNKSNGSNRAQSGSNEIH